MTQRAIAWTLLCLTGIAATFTLTYSLAVHRFDGASLFGVLLTLAGLAAFSALALAAAAARGDR